MHNVKFSFIYLPVALLINSSAVFAKCPCDSFADYYEKLIGDTDSESLSEINQILPCLYCREELGLHFYLCNVPSNVLLAWPKIIEKYGHYNRNMINLADDSKDKCEENIHYDIDKHIRGKKLINAGIPLVIVGCGLSLFTPSVIKWGFGEVSSDLLFAGVFVYLGKVFVSLAYGFAGGLSLGGGTAMIIIGNKKAKEYQLYLDEIKLFKNDLKKIGIISIAF